MQAQKDDVNYPLRDHIRSVQKQIDEHELYLKGRRDKLVPPEKMGELLEQVLNKNERLQLIALETLPATPLIEPPAAKPDAGAVASAPVAVPVKSPGLDHQVYKHGVKITVRGSYADLMQYLTALEKLPTQMYWGAAKMNVTRYPTVELTLTLYTLSLDAIWLRV
jgi:MSHA biogenesis protein MshJ